ncbi:MAG: HIT domain-containing protein [Acidimicrobiia bacterium]|nr:HIT domain-containing protein [Acidimicrobiia bacterium]
MTLDRIWAGWRSAYVRSVGAAPAEDEGCILCRLADVEDPEGLVLDRDALTFAVMNAYPYTSGHAMVAPIRHEADLEGLTEDEAAAVMAMVRRAAVAMKAAFRPDGLNVGINLGRGAGAGVPGHLHVHVLPRWAADTNFMTSVAEARVLPEDLATSWERLRAAWPR